jgi:3-deoxy-D-manno-octulosonic-acid transferase
MARILYNIGIIGFRLALWLVSPFNPKARKMINGRKRWEAKLQDDMDRFDSPIVWFHCASLGEFEQGRPLIDAFKNSFPNYKILLTFYSPSGYEVRKKYPAVDAVHYLPWDSASNASSFYQLVKPAAAIFIKYEFWYHLINRGAYLQIPVIVCSAIFNRNQIFFKPWGGLFRKMLKKLNHIFVQNIKSAELLKSINIANVTAAGDTRVDRVASIIDEAVSNEVVEQFINGQEVFIVGSSWPQDMMVLAPLINSQVNLKFIIAPHEINDSHLEQLSKLIKRPMAHYSKFSPHLKAEVLILDVIGILSHVYRYGRYAYIGGGFGKGLHNILEAATFGLPLFFGNRNYTKFEEAGSLIRKGGAFAISDSDELLHAFNRLYENENRYEHTSKVCSEYINQNTGATNVIMDHLKFLLS